VRGEAFAPVPNRGMITLSIMLANIMQGLDNTILNVALPHIQGSLSASLDDAIDDGGQLAAHPAVQTGAEDLSDFVCSQAP
jgi:hypothetical protein